MKRLHFIITSLATTIGCLIAGRLRATASPAITPMQVTWAERIVQETARTNRRRFEHWIQARHCHGEYDHLYPSEKAAARRASCAKICGLCRYINSLPVWPVSNYQRPPQSFLKAIKEQPYCLTWRSQPPYKKIPRV